MVDVSGSMDHPRTKLKAAVEATLAAIDCLPDGTLFGVIAGTEHARRVYPTGGQLEVASAETRRAARIGVSRLQARGGTAMGRWLMEAYNWLASYPEAIRHAVLLTDGRNETESGEYFAAARRDLPSGLPMRLPRGRDRLGGGRAASRSRPRCSARSTSWPTPRISQPTSSAIMRVSAWARTWPIVRLRRVGATWARRSALVQQVAPEIVDAHPRRGVAIDDRTLDFPTGSVGETRPATTTSPSRCRPRAVGRRDAGRAGGAWSSTARSPSQSLIRAVWTDDVARRHASTLRSPTTPGKRSWQLAIDAGTRSPQSRRRAHRDDPARASGAAGRRERERRHAAAPGQGDRDRRCGHGHGEARQRRGRGGTRWRSTPVRPRPSGSPRRADGDLPGWP